MKKVPDTHHLHKRGGAWYYRRRVPKHLQAVIGTPVIQVSLNTASKKAAIKLREIRDVEWSAKFAKVEADLKGSATTSGQTPAAQRKALTEPVAIELVQQYVEETDKRRRDSAVAHPPLNSEERLEAEQNTQIELAIARDRAPAYDHEEVISSACHEIFSSVDLAVDETTYPSAELFDLVKRACIELEKRALARTRDDHRHHFFDRLFDPKQPSAVTVSDLAGQFMTLKGEEALAFKVARRTLDKDRANVALVREMLGDETLVRELNWDVCRRFCSVLAQLPPNRTKIYPGLPLGEAIARAKQERRPTLSAVTQQNYLAALKELLALAVKKDLIRVNYAEDLRPLRVDDLAPDEKRKPFEIGQLKIFFNSEFYRTCADGGEVPYRHADMDWRYWFPLLSLYTGMRPKEIFQLHVDDLKPTEKGTYYFDVAETTDEDDAIAPERKKTIKTMTSRRKIPVHPELVNIGFIAFVADQRHGSDDPLLFRNLKRDGYNDPASYPLKRFREVYLKMMELKPKQSAYSFRHTWRDAARRINASPDFLKALGGWSDGKTTSDSYGSKHQPDLYAKDMARIAYEGLDLSHLHLKATSP